MSAPPSGSPDLLPIPRTGLIGRDSERATARSFLVERVVPLLTLTGPGGVGKTRLALALAAELALDFADGVVWVDLAPVTDPAQVSSTLSEAVAATRSIDGVTPDTLITYLRPLQTLLVLDNCEHLRDAVGTLVARVLTACPALQVVATSRTPLRVRGEQILPVPPLEVPQRGSPLHAVCTAPAVVLFVQRAQAVEPHFALTEQHAEVVTQICQRLDGLPLAIELAAARVSLLSPAALLALLNQRLPALATAPRDAPARHQTLEAAIAWSYELLSPDEQALFRHLTIFVGGWTLEAAASVTGKELGETLACLDALASQQLIVPRRDVDASSPRFTMLETMRAFGLERLHASGDEANIRNRHLAFFRRMVVELDLYRAFPGDPAWLDLVAPDVDNLRQALTSAYKHGDQVALSVLSSAMAALWLTRSHFAEGRLWLERAIAGDQDVPAILRARCREALGAFLNHYGEADIATPMLDEALTLARAGDDLAVLRDTLQTLGFALRLQHCYARAMALHEEEEQVARIVAVDDPSGGLFVGSALYQQGVVARHSGDAVTAMARFAVAEPFLRAPGGQRRLATILSERGVIELMAGQVHVAARTLVEALALLWTWRYDMALTRPLRGMAGVAARTNQAVAATWLLAATEVIDAKSPSGVVAQRRDGALLSWCHDHLPQGDHVPEPPCRPEADVGTMIAQAVAVARDVAGIVLGVTPVNTMWLATGAPDPGPHSPTTSANRWSSSRIPATFQRSAERASLALTPREQDVLRLLGQRLTNAEIAEHLFVEHSTVATHVANLRSKLGAANRREAAAIAVRHGLI